MPRLENPKHEQFCQYVAAGMPRYKAYQAAGYKPRDEQIAAIAAHRLWDDRELTSIKVRDRVSELLEQRRKAAEMSYDDILQELLDTAELAKEANQHSAAIKAIELIGRERFRMFTERRENINVSLDNLGKAELTKLLHEKFGDSAQELISTFERMAEKRRINAPAK